jgi:glycosyltransferase involved in cell wall biosynthesis
VARLTTRITFVHSILFFGSTEWYVAQLAERIDPDAFELWLVVPDHPSLARLLQMEQFSGRVRTVPTPVTTGALGTMRAYLGALREIGADLVHSIDVDPPALIAARLARVGPLVVTFHTPELVPRDNLRGRALRRLVWATRPQVIFTSEPDRETGLDGYPIARSRSSVIPFGLDLERFSPGTPDRLREELGLSPGVRVVGTVGLLRAQKAHDQLIRAAVEVLREEPDTVFVVVGEGEMRSELERQLREEGLEGRFHLLGQRDDVPELLAGFDVFALSSRFEGMCFAVAEAMAMAKPVVATAVGGVRQSVVPGQTGLLVPPGDPHALAEGILRLLRNPREAEAFAAAGRERALRLYALDRMVAETTALYRRLLAQ